ncbi:MAG TPA: drug/metabolite exporter YedA [Dokdonella sp.]|uniref:drug/metabolite exporter YedA n=1 Tax=Dokdonella sp. TaxID=2291710 RepID=UPI0025C40DF9|nr:drug/metabolite exporter YedA [Dokdonella sp.]MBX3692311.1 drug/metabolite exporter YedA [Dokdonella sp.]MCW5567806.1 drug/metabolite exporter YedA [Dokdonella sp.]HNR92582.1 drug/metabolite exporter YedA [Dokdonella sp.]
MNLAPNPRVLVPLALLAVYLVWGSTYLAIRLALESWPPFTMAATRFLVAGGVLYAFLRWRGMAAPTRPQWINAAFSGTLLLGLGNGLVCYAEQSVASGIAAVAVAGMPLFAAVFTGLYGQWPRRAEWLGLAVGFAGVILLNLGAGMSAAPLGAIALITAAAAWAFGSVWSRRRNMPPGAMNTAAQMLCGGAALTLGALLAGERPPASPSLDATLALVYLIVFGSLLAFTAYLYLLQAVRPLLATSYAYVNPPVAVLLGAWFGGETIHAGDVAAMAIILAGVALITLTKSQPRVPAGRPGPNVED